MMIQMMTGRIDNTSYRIMLEKIRKEMEKRKVKPVTPTENGGSGGISEKNKKNI
tara:strand:- start:959 stop:1120 length:162 start_codon:yes stop_codon:yes gene_type:complete